MRVDPAALHSASAGARKLAAELPRLADEVAASADAAATGCPGFAFSDALVEVAASWRGRLAEVGVAYGRTADGLGATARRDVETDHAVAEPFRAGAG
ncbi:hypothetical protein [Yinghuangia seranimata]|uniref:hypothetical protein n=1 Tax=Yinghuangia seranimata TaxID=408067 RepID=UPI00248B1ADE|nr:hypothetical protein [Yinghuangia seranimata]MDI2131908.1 hypothetical protein [Yinghuangia seranimata]